MIWKFTDNKQFSRFNQTLYDKIVEKAKTVQVPNDGTLKINNTTEMVYSFRNFISNINEYQNYFGYRIYFRNITPETNLTANSTTTNTSTQNPSNQTEVKANTTQNATYNKEEIAKIKSAHNTGNPLVILVLSLAVIVFKRRL